MNIVGINFESIVDGEGVRVVVFASGCKHNCKGCHNPASHSFTAGRPFTQALQTEVIDYIKTTPFVSGLTLSGGDPMYSAKEIVPFIQRLRSEVQDITIWIYTGFSFETILENREMLELLKLCDVLVDGAFVLELRDITLPYKGSKNQRIIDIQKSLERNNIVLWGEMCIPN